MSDLTPSSYKQIADYLGLIQSYGEDMRDHVGIAKDYLDNNEVPNNNDSKVLFSNTLQDLYNSIESRHYDITSEMANFVVKLQNYIIDVYGDINEFLSSNNTMVNIYFAELSEELGFPIDSSNIEPICAS